MSDVEVSIIMPCYNCETTLQESADSVLNQQGVSLELLLIDDGSEDQTVEMIEEIVRNDPRVRFLSQSHKGPYIARNLGIRESVGEFIAFLDSDDLFQPGKLKRQVEHLRDNKSIELSHTRAMKIDIEGRTLDEVIHPALTEPSIFLNLLIFNRIVTSTVMVRRSTFEKVGMFDERFRGRGDWEMWTRIASEGEIGLLDSVDSLYRVHDGNMSNNVARMFDNHAAIIESNKSRYSKRGLDVERCLSEATKALLTRYTWRFREVGDLKRSRALSLQLIANHPFSFPGYKAFLRTFLPARAPSRSEG